MRKIVTLSLFVLSILPLVSSGQSCAVAQYFFSGNAADSSGNGLNGTVYGATLTQDRFGNPNSAYAFDGIDDYILVNHNSLLNFDVNDDFSISLWFKASATQNLNYSSNELISKWVDNPTAGTNQSYPYVFRLKNQSASANNERLTVARFDRSCQNFPQQHSTSLLLDDMYHHAVFVKDGTSLKLYIDNVLESSLVDNTSCSTINNNDLYIGRRGGTTNAAFFTGEIDDIQIFNCALDSVSVSNLFNNTSISLEEQTAIGFDEYSLYPNPFTEQTTLSIDSKNLIEGSIQVYNSQGKLIISETIKNNKAVINRAQMASGLYFYNITSNQKILHSGKLIAQ